MLPPSRDRQQFPGSYAELDALDEAATRSSNIAGDGSTRDDGAGGGGHWRRSPVGLHRPDHLRPLGAGPRHRQPQGRARAVPEVDGFLPVVAPASAYWLDATSTTPPRRSSSTASPTRCTRSTRRSSTPGFLLQVDDAVLMHEWDTMLSRGQTDEDYRRWAAAARRRAQPRAARAARGPRPLPRLLGQLARPPRLRPAAARHRRADPAGQRRLLLDGAGQPPPRARVAGLGGRDAAGGQEAHPRGGHPPHQRRRASGARRPAARPARERRRARERDGRNRLRLRPGRVHPPRPPEIQWAKLAALAEGARIASRELWGAAAAV